MERKAHVQVLAENLKALSCMPCTVYVTYCINLMNLAFVRWPNKDQGEDYGV